MLLGILGGTAKIQTMSIDEKRSESRIQAGRMAKVIVDGKIAEGSLSNLSHRSAGISFPPDIKLGNVGKKVQLQFDTKSGELTIQATMIRSDTTDTDTYHAFRFSALSESDEKEIESYIEGLMGGTGGEGRKHVRICHRTELGLGDGKNAILDNLSLGGLAMLAADSMDDEAEIVLSILHPETHEILELESRVVYCVEVEANQAPPDVAYRVGVEFIRMGEGQFRQLKSLLRHFIRTP